MGVEGGRTRVSYEVTALPVHGEQKYRIRCEPNETQPTSAQTPLIVNAWPTHLTRLLMARIGLPV